MADVNHTPAENTDVTKDVNAILLKRGQEFREAVADRPSVAVFTVLRDSTPTVAPEAESEPVGNSSNLPAGAPLPFAYDLSPYGIPSSQTIDLYVESSNFSPADIVPVLEKLESKSEPIKEPEPAQDSFNSYCAYAPDRITDFMNEFAFRISSKSDADNNCHYLFENARHATHALVFKVNGNYMLKINNLLIPLQRFLTLKQCIAVELERKKITRLELREDPKNHADAVLTTFEDDSTVQINHISVDCIMCIVSHLGRVYGETPSPASPLSASPLPASPPASPPTTPEADSTPAQDQAPTLFELEEPSFWTWLFDRCCPRRR